MLCTPSVLASLFPTDRGDLEHVFERIPLLIPLGLTPNVHQQNTPGPQSCG
jgi:hypothetical protein